MLFNVFPPDKSLKNLIINILLQKKSLSISEIKSELKFGMEFIFFACFASVLVHFLMGYFGIPIKPSTILVFSIAFGISVDDTIHFLAKYRQELEARKWKIKPSVLHALSETGKSMFYTSIVLFFGFLTFTLSSFGGTQALGSLVSVTLLIAMATNLLLLPALLLSLEKRITNKKDLKKMKEGFYIKVSHNVERFWAEVTSIEESGSIYARVDNDLVNEHPFKCDDKILVERRHILDVQDFRK